MLAFAPKTGPGAHCVRHSLTCRAAPRPLDPVAGRSLQNQSAASGAQKLLLKNPDRSKQHTRRFPAASISHAFLTRRARVSDSLAEVIQWIQIGRASCREKRKVAEGAV